MLVKGSKESLVPLTIPAPSNLSQTVACTGRRGSRLAPWNYPGLKVPYLGEEVVVEAVTSRVEVDRGLCLSSMELRVATAEPVSVSKSPPQSVHPLFAVPAAAAVVGVAVVPHSGPTDEASMAGLFVVLHPCSQEYSLEVQHLLSEAQLGRAPLPS